MSEMQEMTDFELMEMLHLPVEQTPKYPKQIGHSISERIHPVINPVSASVPDHTIVGILIYNQCHRSI